MGSYGSPTFMKNTVESLLCKQAEQEWQRTSRRSTLQFVSQSRIAIMKDTAVNLHV